MRNKVLILRGTRRDMTHRSFVWPKSGPVECPDWSPTTECGGGLHGFLWGEGEYALLHQNELYQVIEVDLEDVVNLGRKVKFSHGEVVLTTEDLHEATTYVFNNGGRGREIMFLRTMCGDHEPLTGGSCLCP